MRAVAFALATLLAIVSAGSGANAQQRTGIVQSPILTVDSERLYQLSAFGLRAAREIEARGAALAAENRKIEADLSAEERALTDDRPQMTPEGFRILADAFDEKVQEARRTQEAKTRELSQQLEQDRVAFLNASAPVLEGLMREAGAAVIVEKRSVFLSANAIDITDAAIARIDAVLGDGSD